jgi:type IV secretion system protein VirB10
VKFVRSGTEADEPGVGATNAQVEPANAPSSEDSRVDVGAETVAGERGIPSINRVRSVQSRLTSVLAITLMGTLGLGLLGWYYKQMLSRPSQAREHAQAAMKRRSQAEMPLPPLGRIEPPTVEPLSAEASGPLESFLGPPPELPPERPDEWRADAPRMSGHTVKSAEQVAFERRLSGPVFATRAYVESASQSREATHIYGAQGAGAGSTAVPAGLAVTGTIDELSNISELHARLRPTPTPAVSAQVLPTQQLLLPKGAFIDCTLETAIDSTLPGMTTCIVATDSFSADGSVVLLERGTKLVGEMQGDVRQGAARVFVVWTQARTPSGVVIALDSPGTDELGRSGLPGEVNRHFWQRFGAAILVSVIDGVVQSAVRSTGDGGETVVVSPSGSQSVMTEVLKGTINIPPTVVKRHGDRIQVLVARDLDFRSVYELRAAEG